MIKFRDLSKRQPIEKVIVHSIDLALYQVSILKDGEEVLLADKKNRPLKAHSTLAIEALFEGYQVDEMVLRHESAYDEMVNQPAKMASNRMEVPLGRNKLGQSANDA